MLVMGLCYDWSCAGIWKIIEDTVFLAPLREHTPLGKGELLPAEKQQQLLGSL